MNKITLSLITLLIVAELMLSACAFQRNIDVLKGTSWKLVSYGPSGQQFAAAPGIERSLDFGSDGRVSGNMGCNSFGGNYEVKNGEILFSQMVSTMMACLGPQMEQERATLKAMNGTVRFRIEGNTLTIFDASGAIAITFSK